MVGQRYRVVVLGAALVMLAGAAAYLYLATSWFEPGAEQARAIKSCNVCGAQVPFKALRSRADAVCPSCGAAERHRLLVDFLAARPELLAPGRRVLHFAPNRGVEAYLRGQPGLVYTSADLFAKADLRLDITAIDQPDASWDLVICYHVLEHILDDEVALAELHRVLVPGGKAILQVPLERGRERTHEDPSVTSPEQRLEQFGQEDHVRIYGTEDFPRALAAAGFEVEAVDHLSTLAPELVARHQLARGPAEGPSYDERIWIVTKPLR